MNIQTGTVKWFNEAKGFGFITPHDGGDDIFVHYSGVAGTGFKVLKEGQDVTYETAPGRKGLQAVNVAPSR